MSKDIKKPGTNQKAHGKNSAEKDPGEAPRKYFAMVISEGWVFHAGPLMGWVL